MREVSLSIVQDSSSTHLYSHALQLVGAGFWTPFVVFALFDLRRERGQLLPLLGFLAGVLVVSLATRGSTGASIHSYCDDEDGLFGDRHVLMVI